MADFGLAAQIGRGGMGGGGGVAAPPDPTNRMLQLMQLQALQQNMMLARQQEGRAAQQFPLTLEQLRASTATERARQEQLGAQTRTAREQASSAERTGLAESGALDYIRTTPPEERASQARLDALRQANPGAFQLINDQINRAREVQAKAEEAGYSAMRKRFELQQTALTGMSSLLPAITNERNYATLYQDFKVIDPTGARLIGPEFTPENMAALRARMQDLGDLEYKEDAFGRPYTLNKRTGKMEMLAAPTAAPPGAQMGVAPGAFSPQTMAAPDAARAAAGTPIVQPRATAPEGVGPKAAAAAEKKAAEEAVARQAKEAATAKELDNAITEISAAAAPGGLISKSTGSGIGRAIDAAAAFVGTALPGATAGAQLAPIADLALKMVPRFEGPQSDADRAAYERAAGQLADTSIPRATRQAAAKEVVRLMQKRRNEFTVQGAGSGQPARAVTRTGTVNGRRVVQYSDGTVEYAD